MNSRYYLLVLLGCWLLSGGCSTTDHLPVEHEPVGVDWVALASHWPSPPEGRVEIVTFNDLQNSEQYHVRYDIEITRDGLTMVAQTLLGLPLYEVSVSEGEMITTRHMDRLKGLHVDGALADFVLSNWPLAQLMEAAAAVGYSVEQAGNIRSLINSDAETLVEVRRENDAVKIEHHDIPLVVEIRTVSRVQVNR